MATRAYIADRIFTGEEWLHFYAMIVEDGVIRQLLPVTCIPKDIEKEEFEDCIIAPAFIDLQIYGAAGKLLSVYPDAEALIALDQHCVKGGTAYCMPTVATNNAEVVFRCIDAVKQYWNKGGKGILGLHLEGPWINPVKRGAHILELIHPPSMEEVKSLLAYGKGVIRMITLAPEVCSVEVLDLLHAENVIISAGHSNATYLQAIEGFDRGITAVTHLYNAMSPLQHREPGLVGASMDHNKVMASIIPDGYHVDYPAIRIAKQTMQDRLYAITDAVTDTNSGAYQHYAAGDKFESAGILSGSALTMQKALTNLVDHTGIDLEEALRMCSLYPAQVLRRDHELGRIKKDFPATAVILDAELGVRLVMR